MSDKAKASGVSFTGLLTIAFIVLKLCHQIDWSWWWVLAPLWMSMALDLVAGVLAWLAVVLGKP